MIKQFSFPADMENITDPEMGGLDPRQMQLDAIALNPSSNLLLQTYRDAHQNLVA